MALESRKQQDMDDGHHHHRRLQRFMGIRHLSITGAEQEETCVRHLLLKIIFVHGREISAVERRRRAEHFAVLVVVLEELHFLVRLIDGGLQLRAELLRLARPPARLTRGD